MPSAPTRRKKGAGGRDYAALTEEAIDHLQQTMRKSAASKGRGAPGHCVSAARELLMHSRWKEDREREQDPIRALIRILGTDEAALAWMRETLPKLEARVSSHAPPALSGAPQESP